MINLGNVKVGDTFSTLTKLYGALELPNVKGNQKIAQDKEIARHLKYELTGTNKRCKNEIVITEIYDIPLEKVDGRIENGQNKYIDEIIPLLCNYISRVKKQNITSSKLLVELGIIGFEYLNIFNDTSKLVNRMTDQLDVKITVKTLEDFYCNINRTMNSALRGALSKLDRQGKLTYKDITYVILEDEEIAHEADEKELAIIKENEEFVLEKLVEDKVIKEPKINSIYTIKQRRKYNKLLDNCLLEDGIKKVWKSIYIKNINCEAISIEEENSLISTIRSKFAETVERRMTNINFLPPYYKDKAFNGWNGKVHPSVLIRPYADFGDNYGWLKMKETIKFMYMLDANSRKEYINKLDDNVKEMIEIGVYDEKDIFPF